MPQLHLVGVSNYGHQVAGLIATRKRLSPWKGQRGVSVVERGGREQTRLVAPDNRD